MKHASFFQVCFHTVLSSILECFLITFQAPEPRFHRHGLWFRGVRHFCCKVRKICKMTSQSHQKWLPECLQKPLKLYKKTKPKNNTKNQRFWLPRWSQNGLQMASKSVCFSFMVVFSWFASQPTFSNEICSSGSFENIKFSQFLDQISMNFASFLASWCMPQEASG